MDFNSYVFDDLQSSNNIYNQNVLGNDEEQREDVIKMKVFTV